MARRRHLLPTPGELPGQCPVIRPASGRWHGVGSRASGGQGSGEAEAGQGAGAEHGHGADAGAGQGDDEQAGGVQDAGVEILAVEREDGAGRWRGSRSGGSGARARTAGRGPRRRRRGRGIRRGRRPRRASGSSSTSARASRPNRTCTRWPRRSSRPRGSSTRTTTPSCCRTPGPCGRRLPQHQYERGAEGDLPSRRAFVWPAADLDIQRGQPERDQFGHRPGHGELLITRPRHHPAAPSRWSSSRPGSSPARADRPRRVCPGQPGRGTRASPEPELVMDEHILHPGAAARLVAKSPGLCSRMIAATVFLLTFHPASASRR